MFSDSWYVSMLSTSKHPPLESDNMEEKDGKMYFCIGISRLIREKIKDKGNVF